MPPTSPSAITTTHARHRGLPISLLGDQQTGWIVVAALGTPFELPLGTIAPDPKLAASDLEVQVVELLARRTRAERQTPAPSGRTG